MAYSLIANTAAQASGGAAVTTAGINTTGANLIVVSISWYSQITDISLVDSNGNTWQTLTQVDKDDWSAQMFWAYAPTVGSGHTFTTTNDLTFATICVTAWSGSTSSPFDQQSTGQANGTTVQPGSITPTEDNELVITHLGQRDNTNTATVNGGFTISDQFANNPGNALGGAQAYLIQTTAAAANPTWTADNGGLVALIASFKASAGGGTTVYTRLLASTGVGGTQVITI